MTNGNPEQDERVNGKQKAVREKKAGCDSNIQNFWREGEMTGWQEI